METADYKRLLKYRLHPADVLFFRCIPGNDGEWLFPLLEAHFPAEQIFPPDGADSEAIYTRYSDEARSKFRLIRGDFEYGTGDASVYRFLSRNPIKITWLRHPLGRAQELHRRALGRGGIALDTPLGDYVRSPQGRQALCNGQARAIVGQTARATAHHDTLGYSLEAFQKLAEDNLEQHHFVGLAEEAERSSQLLSYTFDWEPAGRGRGAAAVEIDPALHRAILQQADYDLAFYELGRELFERRYRQMAAELHELEETRRQAGRTPSESGRTKGGLARIAGAIRRRLPGNRPRRRGQNRRRRATPHR